MSESTFDPEVVERGDEGITRRGFVKVAVVGMCAGYAAAIGYPVFRYLNSPVEKAEASSAVNEVTLKDVDKLPKNSALMFKFGTHPAVLIRHEDDTWVALDAVCTHLGCTVAFDPASKQIVCACHGGVYDAKTGGNVSGPPPKPLTVFKVAVKGGEAKVTRA